MRCYRKILCISYKDHVTKEEVCAKIQQAIGPHEDLVRHILKWYGHVSGSPGLAKTILQGTVKVERWQGRQKTRLEDNIREWTELEFAKTPEGSGEQRKMEETGCEVICGAPTTPTVLGWVKVKHLSSQVMPVKNVDIGTPGSTSRCISLSET